VLHHNAVASTANHPAAQDLTAVKGTFTGTVDINGQELILDADADTSITADTDDQIDIKVAGSDLAHITSTYAKLRGATPLVFGESNSTGTFQSISGEVGANNLLLRSYQSLTFKNGTSGSSLTDGTTALNIDSAGHVTMPLQPYFRCIPASAQNNLSINTWNDIAFATESVDRNADFATATFTAPVTGVYMFTTSLYMQAIDTDFTTVEGAFHTSNDIYQVFILEPGKTFSSDSSYYSVVGSVICDMDASDTCILKIYPAGGAAQMDINVSSTFTGGLLY